MEQTGKQIIQAFQQLISKSSPEALIQMGNLTHAALLEIHSRALACHSECLGMDAENSWAVCNDNALPYNDKCYKDVMEKWGMMDEEGKPII